MTVSVCQINLQRDLGGGEVYTAFLCRALAQLGVPTRLFVHPQAGFWRALSLPADTILSPATSAAAIADDLRGAKNWLIGHGPLPAVLLTNRGRPTTAIAHMPVQDQGSAAFAGHDCIFAVSEWVQTGLRQAGLPVWETPLYGVADLSPRRSDDGEIVRRSSYSWDRRKFRDRLLGWIEPRVEPIRPHPRYERRPGLTLGIVSRLTPIKQFPELFGLLTPMLACQPSINLEIFGSGGYASVRDLRRSLAPLERRVRFWGHQCNVAAVYRSIDYLLAGLPEKEALGLNVIEAQACGTPVLAPAAPPFTETVLDGRTGFLYCDPRQDGGRDFARLLSELLALALPPDPRKEGEHLARFSFDAFVERLRPVVAWAGRMAS